MTRAKQVFCTEFILLCDVSLASNDQIELRSVMHAVEIRSLGRLALYLVGIILRAGEFDAFTIQCVG